MKKNSKQPHFSEAFSNRIDMVGNLETIILNHCTIAETQVILYILDCECFESVELKIYAAPQSKWKDNNGIEKVYGNGFIIEDGFFGFIWYCNSLKEVNEVLTDFKAYFEWKNTDPYWGEEIIMLTENQVRAIKDADTQDQRKALIASIVKLTKHGK